jgi:hypothetical protein
VHIRTSFHFLIITGITPIGTLLIITFPDEDVHPVPIERLKLYVPGVSPEIVVVVPVPVVRVPPGDRVNDHVPEAGNPLRTTLPVVSVQVGCVIVPIAGAEGVTGCASITTTDEGSDMQVPALLIVNVCDPAGIPEIVAFGPVTDVVVPPGDLVITHDPVVGIPLRTTLPVDVAHVG